MINLQLPYSLVERQIEVEHVTMSQTWARHHGMESAWRWIPQRKVPDADQGLSGDGRLSIPGASGLR